MGKLGKCPKCPQTMREQLLIGGLCQNHFSISVDYADGNIITTADIYLIPTQDISSKVLRYKPKKQKPIAKVSVKRKEKNKEYKILSSYFLSENTLCLAKIKGTCTQKATEVHHKAGRSGTNFLDTKTWLPICSRCHHWITEHSAQAIELGLSTSRNKK